MEITVPQAEALWLIGEALLKQARTGVRFRVLPLISLGFQPLATLPVVQRVILSSCRLVILSSCRQLLQRNQADKLIRHLCRQLGGELGVIMGR